tara:strand:- start:117 stop:296 length:180 start_codon:yes stop_codon:yes gene_type:complete
MIDPRLSFAPGWLCQCGAGNLIEAPPEACPLCGAAFTPEPDVLDELDFDADWRHETEEC